MNIFQKKPYIFFILPGLTLYLIFVIYPMFYAFSLSFYDWSGFGPKTFIGLRNFYSLFFDPRISRMFFNALKNNVLFVLAELVLIMPVQIFFAYLIYRKIKGYKIFQALIFLPSVISTAIIGFFIMIVFDPNIGILNTTLQFFHLENWQSAWFGDPKIAFPLFILVTMWVGIGYCMMLFIANMRGISEEMIEAALIDGASGYKLFFYIILPQLWPALTNVIVFDTITGLTLFDIPFIIGGSQGGIDNSLDFLNIFFFRYAFGNSYNGDTAVGFGSAISVMTFLMVATVAVFQLKYLRRIQTESE
ncbi:MAG: sugar ABC transporter permease [Candidatus Vecturithrix sp.]|nr:sugar ABC transporter permease [Candidatus Vecturithrix sp.]